MWKIRDEHNINLLIQQPLTTYQGLPSELRRILLSLRIRKVGVGLPSDILVIWDNLRLDMKNLTDTGLMAKLAIADRYPKQAYSNLSLKTSVKEMLGYKLPKDLTNSNWSAKNLTDNQVKLLDAVAALRLFEVLEAELERKSSVIEQTVPDAWYRFNSRSGEPMRLKPTPEGTELPWRVNNCTWYVGGKYVGWP
ncbi:ribonuclease H-like domain-containing protein [Mycena latifolia]|nr:ribonuclease H-like domain-containing protein [Mycena latifolia]